MAKNVRDTVSGKYVEKGEAKKRPATTVTETSAKKKAAAKPKAKKKVVKAKPKAKTAKRK